MVCSLTIIAVVIYLTVVADGIVLKQAMKGIEAVRGER